MFHAVLRSYRIGDNRSDRGTWVLAASPTRDMSKLFDQANASEIDSTHFQSSFRCALVADNVQGTHCCHGGHQSEAIMKVGSLKKSRAGCS